MKALGLLAALGGAAVALAQTAGTFTATGKMTTGGGHTATLLTDGTVLIVGGSNGESGPLSGAELYDPQTGTFTPMGETTAPREGHTATLLPDGKVLIAGGDAWTPANRNVPIGSLASAELYDPATKTFTPTGNMTMGRWGHAATLLPSGKVLIAGGFTLGISTRDPDPVRTSAELYDPLTGIFTPTGTMAGAGGGPFTAISLASGKVLIAPRYNDGLWSQSEIYDPSTATFSSTVNTPACCQWTATQLMNGSVLFAYNQSGSTELYDPASGIFTTIENITPFRIGHTATLLPDGNVLFAGGTSSDIGDTITYWAGAELYDPANRTFSSTGSMSGNRFDHTATLLNDGRVLIAGGSSFVGTVSGNFVSGRADVLSSAEIYNPAVLVPPPVLLSVPGDGDGKAAILHAATHQVLSAGDPAVAGEALEIYCTGLAEGSVIPPFVVIGGRLAEVLFFGKAPGYDGLNQVNVRVPGGVAAGDAIPVRLQYLGRSSSAVTIAVQ